MERDGNLQRCAVSSVLRMGPGNDPQQYLKDCINEMLPLACLKMAAVCHCAALFAGVGATASHAGAPAGRDGRLGAAVWRAAGTV